MTHAFNSGCPCCLPTNGLSRRQFLCTTAAGVAAAPLVAAAAGGEAQAATKPTQAGRPILIKGGCVLSLDKRRRRLRAGRRADRGQEDHGGEAEHQRAERPGDRRVEPHRHAGLRRYPPSHVAGLPAQRAAGRLARGLPQRRAAHIRRQDDAGRCLCRRLHQRARRHRRRRDLHPRLVAHPEFARAHRRLHQGTAGIRACARCSPMARARTRPAGSWRSPTAKYPGDIARLRKQYFSSDDQLVTLYLAALGGTPEATLSQFKAARDVGARITIHVGVGEFGRNALLEKAQRRSGPQGRHHLHPLLHAQRHRMEADQGHRRHRSRSRAMSRR